MFETLFCCFGFVAGIPYYLVGTIAVFKLLPDEGLQIIAPATESTGEKARTMARRGKIKIEA
jgi:hypothetical protein